MVNQSSCGRRRTDGRTTVTEMLEVEHQTAAGPPQLRSSWLVDKKEMRVATSLAVCHSHCAVAVICLFV